jgi:hypothetical protein
MADLIYSTSYGNAAGSIIWTPSHGLAGFFQIKEDRPSAEPFGSAVFRSPAPGYKYEQMHGSMDLTPYEEARHWPHP